MPIKAGNTNDTMTHQTSATRQFCHRGFELRSSLDEEVTKQVFDTIIERSYEATTIFKDSRSTYAARLQVGNLDIVHKIPRARLKRTWEKITTLIREIESIRTFKNLQLMHELGLKAPAPLLAEDLRRKGFVADSFCCYRFAEGKGAGPDDAALVVAELLKLHAKGYLRTDTKAANFFISDGEVTFIDFRLKKPLIFPTFKKRMELARLARTYPESLEALPGEIRTSATFRLARWMERKSIEIKSARRRIKDIFRTK